MSGGKAIDFYMMKKEEDIGCCINMVVEVLDCKMVKMKVMVFSDPWFFYATEGEVMVLVKFVW